jgi:dihydropteroate synthase
VSTRPAGATLELGAHRLPLGQRTLLMGIVNNTPDSFYDRGRHFGPEAAVAHGRALLEAGADVLDVGGQTGQVGQEIALQEECERVLPVLEALRDACVSVDTYRAPVARAALAAGASFVNDYTGGHDPELAAVVGDAGAGLVITHYRGRPRSNPSRSYDATVDEVLRFLERGAAAAVEAGVGERSIIVDPGLGFGKATRLDLALLRDLDRVRGLGFPVLVACSHKEVTADASGLDEDDLRGTAVVAALAARAGVAMLRLHDVGELAPVVRLADAIRSVEGP